MIPVLAGRVKLKLAISLPLSAGLIMLHSCISFRMSEKKIDGYLGKHHINGRQHKYRYENRNIHYVQAGNESKPLVVFVHGSPGSRSAFIHFLKDTALTNHFLVISTDRPGFGSSNFGMAEPSLQNQANLLKPILEKHNQNRPIILVGHSLGGPVIARMAMEYPHLVDGLVLVAASIDPDLEPNESWFRIPLATPFLRWILPRSFRASNEEIVDLRHELAEMLPLWSNIRCPVVVVQGGSDKLVPPDNAQFAEKMLVNTPVDIILKEDMNHFVPWSHPELIKLGILNVLAMDSSVIKISNN
jgi:pimeloyl-ACP methyl ester carboxylesterase